MINLRFCSCSIEKKEKRMVSGMLLAVSLPESKYCSAESPFGASLLFPKRGSQESVDSYGVINRSQVGTFADK